MNLILLYGPPAAGKLTIAKELERKLGYKLIDNHKIMNLYSDIFPASHPTNALLTREFRLRIVEEAVKADIDLIMTSATAGSPTLFDYYAELFKKVEDLGAKLLLIHLTADPNTLLSRVEDESRRSHGKTLDQKGLLEILERDHALGKYPNLDHLTIDTSKISPEKLVEEIIASLKVYYALAG